MKESVMTVHMHRLDRAMEMASATGSHLSAVSTTASVTTQTTSAAQGALALSGANHKRTESPTSSRMVAVPLPSIGSRASVALPSLSVGACDVSQSAMVWSAKQTLDPSQMDTPRRVPTSTPVHRNSSRGAMAKDATDIRSSTAPPNLKQMAAAGLGHARNKSST